MWNPIFNYTRIIAKSTSGALYVGFIANTSIYVGKLTSLTSLETGPQPDSMHSYTFILKQVYTTSR